VRILFDNATDNLSTAFVETGLAASETRPIVIPTNHSPLRPKSALVQLKAR
jgi:hypothetical protein